MGEWPTIPELFRITETRFPHRNCFSCFDPLEQRFSFQEALASIERIGAFLLEQGIKPGDRVAVTGKNSPEWALAYLGILFAGGVVVPLDYQLAVVELKNLITRSQSFILFVEDEKREEFLHSGLRQIISLSPGSGRYILDLNGKRNGEFPKRSEHDLAAILFTSGTTGNAKGVMLSHKNLVSDAFLSQGNLPIYSSDVFYALLPIHHSYTMLAVFIESLSVGAEIVFGKHIAVQQILKELKKGQVTMFLGIPMLFNKLLKGIMRGIREKGVIVYGAIRLLMVVSGLLKKLFGFNPGKKMFGFILKKVALDTNRICISGGGPLPGETFRRFNQLGIDFVQGYGLTETSPIITLNPTDHYKEESVGRVIQGMEVKIDHPDAQGRGEILVKGPNVMMGYFNMEAETAAVLGADGFLHTGDVGYLDKENYLYLTGRMKSLIVTEGGKNVYPEEIEENFQLYEEVEQIMVRGFAKDAKMKQEAIEALIYPAPAAFPDIQQPSTDPRVQRRLQQIIDEVNHRLHPFQRIERFTLLDEPMAMTTTKKIKRYALLSKSGK